MVLYLPRKKQSISLTVFLMIVTEDGSLGSGLEATIGTCPIFASFTLVEWTLNSPDLNLIVCLDCFFLNNGHFIFLPLRPPLRLLKMYYA